MFFLFVIGALKSSIPLDLYPRPAGLLAEVLPRFRTQQCAYISWRLEVTRTLCNPAAVCFTAQSAMRQTLVRGALKSDTPLSLFPSPLYCCCDVLPRYCTQFLAPRSNPDLILAAIRQQLFYHRGAGRQNVVAFQGMLMLYLQQYVYVCAQRK